MTLSIGANTQNTLYPTQDVLDSLSGSNLANANLSPTAANDFGPAVIISLSPQALSPETEAGGTVVVSGERITEADRQRLSQLSTLNGITTSDTRDTASQLRNLDLATLQVDLNNPDEVHTGEDGKVKQQFSTERVLRTITFIKDMRKLVDNPQMDPSLKAKAIQAMNLINESPLGKTIAAAQLAFGIDIEGLEAMLQGLPPGQALEYTQENDPNAAGSVALATARKPTPIDPLLGNVLSAPYVNPTLPTFSIPSGRHYEDVGDHEVLINLDRALNPKERNALDRLKQAILTIDIALKKLDPNYIIILPDGRSMKAGEFQELWKNAKITINENNAAIDPVTGIRGNYANGSARGEAGYDPVTKTPLLGFDIKTVEDYHAGDANGSTQNESLIFLLVHEIAHVTELGRDSRDNFNRSNDPANEILANGIARAIETAEGLPINPNTSDGSGIPGTGYSPFFSIPTPTLPGIPAFLPPII